MKRVFIILLLVMFVIAGCNTIQDTKPVVVQQQEEVVQKDETMGQREEGNIAFENEDYEKALEHYNLWLSKHNDDTETIILRGRAKCQLKQYREALEDFRTASKTDICGKIQEARMLLMTGKVKPAQSIIIAAIKDKKFSKCSAYYQYMAYYMAGQIYNMLEKYDDALAILDSALEAYEESPSVFEKEHMKNANRFAIYQKSVALHYKNNNVEAAKQLEEYMTLTKQAGDEVSSKDYKSLALAYYLSNNIKKCKAVLPELTPEDRESLHAQFGDSFFRE